MAHILVEVCVDGIDDAIVAVQAGADRLELNAALSLGGLTPSPGLVAEVRRHVSPDFPLVAMVRPRAGGFCYTSAELDVMRYDVDAMLAEGANGIAWGILTTSGEIDRAACASLFARVLDSPTATEGVVFHRAFDFVPDAPAALERLIDLGVRRVLTSGLQSSALTGIQTIADLVKAANGRIEVLPGGGIGPENAAQIVAVAQVNQMHGSFREACVDAGGSLFARRPGVVLGSDGASGSKTQISPQRIKATIEQLQQIRI